MYPCKFENCSYEFPTKQALAAHVRNYHKPDEVKKPLSPEPESGETPMDQMMIMFERLYQSLINDQAKRAKIERICELTIATMQTMPSLPFDEAIARAVEIYRQIESEG